MYLGSTYLAQLPGYFGFITSGSLETKWCSQQTHGIKKFKALTLFLPDSTTSRNPTSFSLAIITKTEAKLSHWPPGILRYSLSTLSWEQEDLALQMQQRIMTKNCESKLSLRDRALCRCPHSLERYRTWAWLNEHSVHVPSLFIYNTAHPALKGFPTQVIHWEEIERVFNIKQTLWAKAHFEQFCTMLQFAV